VFLERKMLIAYEKIGFLAKGKVLFLKRSDKI